MTSERWDVGVWTDPRTTSISRFDKFTPSTMNAQTERADFCWVPSGEMESAEHEGHEPSTSSGSRESCRREAIVWGCDETSEKIVHSLQHRRQSLAEAPCRGSTSPEICQARWVQECTRLFQESQRYGLLVLSSCARTLSAILSTSLIDDAGGWYGLTAYRRR